MRAIAGRVVPARIKLTAHALASSARRLLLRACSRRAVWKLGLPHEVEFWEGWLRDLSGEEKADIRNRLNPDMPLQPHLAELLEPQTQSPPAVLDVGAGPISSVGKVWNGQRIRLVPVDPLAQRYAELCASYGIEVPVPTVFAHAEDLVSVFPSNHFDLAYARNSLDHSFDPFAAFRQMLDVVKPGRWVVLEHFAEEGKHANYAGLHQWDFDVEEGEFVVRGPSGVRNVSRELAPYAEIMATKTPDRWVSVRIRKHSSPQS